MGPNFHLSRSSQQRCSVGKGVLRNSVKFKGKHLCQSLFFNKVAGLEAFNFIKKETLTQVFCCELCEISKSTFFTEHLWATASGYQRSSLEHCSLWWLSLFNSSPNAFASRIRFLFSSDKPYFIKLICLKWRTKWFNLILTKIPALKPTLG